MAQYQQFHNLLLEHCPNVYFSEPGNLQMVYPAIVYKPDDEDRLHAGNSLYRLKDEYLVTIMDEDIDSAVRQSVRQIPYCSFNRFYESEGLFHFVYTISF